MFAKFNMMLLKLLRYMIGFGDIRSAEDVFHEHVNKPGSLGRTLQARYIFANSDGLNRCVNFMKELKDRDTKLAQQFRASGLHDVNYQTAVVDRSCNALICEIDQASNIVKFQMNHRMIGGSMFYRLVEGCLGSQSKTLPQQRWLSAIVSAFRMLPCIFKFSLLHPNPLPSGPVINLEKKEYLHQEKGIPRRFAAYRMILEDACWALKKDCILAAFTVAFDDVGHNIPLNNVGVVLIQYKKGSTQRAVQDQFLQHLHHALGSNLFLTSGLARMFGAMGTGAGFRQRVDICCSSMVFGEDCLPCDIYVHPTTQVYEQAYVAMVSRLLPNGGVQVCTAITTNGRVDGWKDCGYRVYSGKD